MEVRLEEVSNNPHLVEVLNSTTFVKHYRCFVTGESGYFIAFYSATKHEVETGHLTTAVLEYCADCVGSVHKYRDFFDWGESVYGNPVNWSQLAKYKRHHEVCQNMHSAAKEALSEDEFNSLINMSFFK
jgi:hypothetical protein